MEGVYLFDPALMLETASLPRYLRQVGSLASFQKCQHSSTINRQSIMWAGMPGFVRDNSKPTQFT